MRVTLIVAWSFLKGGNVLGLLNHWRLKCRHSLYDLLHDRPLAVLKSLRFLPALLGLMIGALVFHYGSLTTPLSTLIVCFALAIALILCALTFAGTMLHGSVFLSFMINVRWIGLRALSFFIPAFVMSWWFHGRPDQEVKAIAVCLVLWFTFYGLFEYGMSALAWQRKVRLKRLDFGHDRLELNDEEYWRVCIHEAGHLLLYGQLDRLPEDAFAVVDRNPKYGFAGFVTPLHAGDPTEATMDLLRWQAVMYYAGAAAERLIFGSHCEGASEDYRQADGAIERLARLSPDSQYFPSPVNPTQESANIMSICRLRTECQLRAEEFLMGNRTQLLSIAEKLQDHESVDCEEFLPAWSTLQVPQGWIKLRVPERIPCLSTGDVVATSITSLA